MGNNHNFNHFTGKRKPNKHAKRKKGVRAKHQHKNKYERFCKAPEAKSCNLYWDTFSEEEKAQLADKLYPFIAKRLADEFETAEANLDFDFDSKSDDIS